MNLSKYFNSSTCNANCYAQISPNKSFATKQNTVEANNTIDLIVIGSLLFIAVSFLLWRLCFQKTSSSLPKVSENPNKTNCTKCHFLNNNSYLKCAVHPDTVLKKEARDCLDYEPKTNSIISNKQ